MKSNYQERKENRLAAFQGLAAKNDQLSTSLYETSHKMADCIPMGQPILVGHYSEKSDRNFRAKIHNKMGASIEAGKKADYYRQRADSLLNGTAISSDDTNAIDKLILKLEALEATQTLYKAINKIVKATKKTDVQKVEEIVQLGIKEATAVLLISPDRYNRLGIPSYKLTNNNGVINNTRKRIEQLQKIEAMPESEEIINGVKLVVNPDDNRVQIFFDGIPAKEIRESLKSRGFHWSPAVGAWMRQISNSAIWNAKQILQNL